MAKHEVPRRLGPSWLAFAIVALLGLGVVGVFLGGSSPTDAAPVCTKTWAAPVSGAWEDPAAWSPAGAPTVADDVCVTAAGTYAVTQHQNVTVHSLQIGGATGSGTASVVVEGVGCSYTSALSVTTTTDISARGRLALTSAGCGGTTATYTGTGTLTNDGTVETVAGNGGSRYLRGPIVNRGTYLVGASTFTDGASTTFDNRGTVSVAAAWTVPGGATVIGRSGTITSAGTGALTLTGGSTFEERGGLTGGTNPVVLQDSALSFVGASPGSRSFVMHNTGTLSGDTPAGTSVTVEGVGCSYTSTVTTAGSFVNAGAIHLTSGGCGGTTASLTGAGTISNTGSISSDVGTGGDRYLRLNVVNTGTITVSQPLTFDQAGTVLDNRATVSLSQPLAVSGAGTTFRNTAGTLVGTASVNVRVAGGASFEQVDGNTSGSPVVLQDSTLRFVNAALTTGDFVMHNTGTLAGDVPAAASVTVEGVGCSYTSTVTTAGSFVNAGAIHLSSGGCGGTTAILTGSGTITNIGTISSDVGTGGDRYLRLNVVNTGTVTVSQPLTFDQAGTVLDNRGTVSLTQPLAVAGTGTTFRNTSGTLDGSGAGTVNAISGARFEQAAGNTSGNAVVLQDSTLAFVGGSPTIGDFVMHNTGTLSGDIPAGVSVTVEGVGCSYTSTVTTSGSFTNAGTIRLSSGGCGGTTATLTGSGSITNTGSITSDVGNGGARYLRTDVVNTGTITVSQPLVYDATSAVLDNQGTVSLNQPLTVSGATFRSTSGSVDGTGAGVLNINGGTFEQISGNASGNPAVLRGSTLEFAAGATGTTAFTVHNAATLAGDVPVGAAITVEGVGCSYTSTLTAPEAFTNAGTIVLTSGGCGGTTATLSAPGGIINTGTLATAPGNGGARNVVTPTLLNVGTVMLPVGSPLALTGNYVQASAGTLQVAVEPGGNGRLNVSGTAAFDGTLRADTTYTPPFGTTFQVASYASATGSFSSTGTTGTQYSIDVGATGLRISVLKASAASLLASPAGATVFGQPLTFTATVVAVAPDTGTPTGVVEFREGTTVLGTATLDGSGHASLTVATLAAGFHDVVAEYLGAGTFGHSTTSVVTRQVARASTSASLASSPNPSDADQDVTLTATVVVVAPGAGLPGGTVTFREGATDLGSAPVGASGQASLVLNTLHVGSHTIVASYAGDLRFTPATSGSISQTVVGVAVATATTVAPGPASLVATQPFSLTADVVRVASIGGSPTGTVTFLDGGEPVGAAPVGPSGRATLALAGGLRGGSHAITAHFDGTTTFDPSDAPAVIVVVGPASASFRVDVTRDAQVPGQVRVAVTASATAPASAVPNGPVELLDGDDVVGQARMVGGQAVLTRCFTAACAPPPPTTTTSSAPPSTTTSGPTTTTSTSITTTSVPPLASTTTAATTTPTSTTSILRPFIGVRSSGRVLAPARFAQAGASGVSHSLVASFAGDGDFAAFRSQPVVVQVDGDQIILPTDVQPPAVTTTAGPTSPTTPTTGPTTPTDPTESPTPGRAGDPFANPAGAGTTSDRTTIGGAVGATAIDEATLNQAPTAGASSGAPTASAGPDEQASPARSEPSASGGGRAGEQGSASRADRTPRAPAAALVRSTFARSTADPRHLDLSSGFVLANVLLATVLLLLVVFPAHMFNSTLAENYDEVLGWFGPVERRIDRFRAKRGRLPAPLVLGGMAVIGALLFGFLDPHFGWTMSSLALVLGLLVSLVLISLTYDVVRARYMKHRFGVVAGLRSYPLGIIIAIVLVGFSRAVHFTPGYLFGVFTALHYHEDIDDKDQGKGLAVGAVAMLLLALGCWLTWGPVSAAAVKPDPSFNVLFLDAALSTTWIVGIQGLFIGMLPLRFLDGQKVFRWSRWVWTVLTGIALFAFVETMVRPGKNVSGGDSVIPTVALFLAFTLVSVAFWAYFRFRKPRPGVSSDDPPEPPQSEPERVLVDA